MKKLLALLLALMLLPCLAAAEDAPAEPGLTKNLVILFTSDIHCGVDENWGYASLYAVKEYYARENHVMLVDDGDAIQGEAVGTLTKGGAIITIMNTLGYDLAIPGNHEFDYGVERFMELTIQAKFPYICCNFSRNGELVFKPYAIREFDGVKFGFVGVTTPMTLRSSVPKYFQDASGNYIYSFMEDETGEGLYEAVQKAVDDVRAEGAQYVILIAHLGNEAECTPWMYSDVISHTSGIDVVLDGHSHDYEKVTVKNKEGKDVLRAACGTKLDNIGVLTVTPDGKMDTQLLAWDKNTPAGAPALLGISNIAADAVQAATCELNEKLGEVVATTPVALEIYDPDSVAEDGRRVRLVRTAETNFGDLVTDAYRSTAGDADVAILNAGAIRTDLKPGNITIADIMRVHPFGNYLTEVEVTGQTLLDALEWSVHSAPGEFGGFLQVSGMKYTFDPTIESPCTDNGVAFTGIDGSKPRRVQSVTIGDAPLDPEKTYKVASNDYLLLSAGDGYTMFKDCKILKSSIMLDNQLLINYITDTMGGVVSEEYTNPYGEGRIVSVGAEKEGE